MPFGDSITVGLGSEGAGGGGYRVHLFELAVNDNKNITFVGKSTQQDAGGPNGPNMVAGKTFPRDHEGHSGWFITGNMGIASRVPSPAFDDDPHIVLIHIGTNDAARGDQAGMVNNLGTLLQAVIETAPNALVVVAQIIPLPISNGPVETYNAGIPDLVDSLASEGKHVLLADLNTGYDGSNLPDMIHPNKAGYDFMAEKWYEVIKDFLPAEQ